MKSIKITTDVRKALKSYSDENMSYDSIIMRLIHDVADIMPMVSSSRGVNINIHEDTMDKLKAYKLSDGESYENIIIRMLIASKNLYNDDE